MRIVDLFCGIGGVAEACRDLADAVSVATRLDALPSVLPEVVVAIDIDRRIVPVYAKNHRVEPIVQAIESIQQIPEADLWWLSPPCQPQTQLSKGLAEQDPRSLGLARVIELIGRERPAKIIVENVPEFLNSHHHQALEETLARSGYVSHVDELCPTQWSVPMQRKRFYLRARRDGVAVGPVKVEPLGRPLHECLDEASWDDPSLLVAAEDQASYERAVNVVDCTDRTAIVTCFTSAYGNGPVQAGSYLRNEQRDSLRRFSPREIGRLMGYREGFWWPDDLDRRARYQLLGNALSVTVVKSLLASMVDLD